MIEKSKRDHYDLVLSTGRPKACFRVINNLLQVRSGALPVSSNTPKLCQVFASFFKDKISLIPEHIQHQHNSQGRLSPEMDPLVMVSVEHKLEHLMSITEDEIAKVIRQCTSKA